MSRFATLLYTPIDLIKCKAQMEEGNRVRYGPIVKQLVAERGVSGLFKGITPILCRELPAWAVYFPSYRFYEQRLTTPEQTRAEYLLNKFVSGGLAGVTMWTVSYPQDVVKTKI